MNYKIGLIGSAGLGKSTFASYVGKELGLYFLKSKDITRPILKKYGYVYGSGMCVEKFLARREIEFALVDERIYNEKLLSGGFITDRTTLECFCYAMLNIEHYSEDEIKMLETLCKSNMSTYTHLYYIPRTAGWIEDNGLRTVSSYFQWKVDMLIRGVLQDWNIKCIKVPEKSSEISNFIINHIKGENINGN